MHMLHEGVSCGELSAPDNGAVRIVGNGVVAVYSCDEAYTLSSRSLTFCQENGEWLGEEPECIRKYTCIYQ